MARRLFVQSFVQGDNKDIYHLTYKHRVTAPLWVNHRSSVSSPHKGLAMRWVSMLWRHHVLSYLTPIDSLDMRTICLCSAKASALTKKYDDVLTRTRFPHRRHFIRGIHRLPVVSTWIWKSLLSSLLSFWTSCGTNSWVTGISMTREGVP